MFLNKAKAMLQSLCFAMDEEKGQPSANVWQDDMNLSLLEEGYSVSEAEEIVKNVRWLSLDI